MAMTNLTPKRAVQTAAHADRATDAAATLASVDWTQLDTMSDAHAAELFAACKALEAAGCYARRTMATAGYVK